VAVGALFDVDGTLIARNSATLYMRHLRRTGQARRRDLAWTLYYLLRYKLGRLDIDEALQESMRFVRGKVEAATRRDADAGTSATCAVALSADGRTRGGSTGVRAVVALVTSATRHLAALARRRARHRALPRDPARRATRAFTGEAVRPPATAQARYLRARELAARGGASISPPATLHRLDHRPAAAEAVGHQRIVNPDLLLAVCAAPDGRSCGRHSGKIVAPAGDRRVRG
jgi:phosphoserine phosphatase